MKTTSLTPTALSSDLRAYCVADRRGGITFELTRPEALGRRAGLLLRRRRGEQFTHEERLPLVEEPAGRLRAELPVEAELREGRWEVFLELDDEEPVRVLPGVNDLRALLDRAPAPDESPLRVRIPYPTKEGHLAVRAWQRGPHAEAGELAVGEDRFTLKGRLYAAEFTDGAYLEVDPRGSDEPALHAELTVTGDEFTAVLTYHGLKAGFWDLRLRPTGEQGPRVRVGRLLDDVADKKPVFTYPPRQVNGEYGPAKAEPYYTIDNDLSIRVTAES